MKIGLLTLVNPYDGSQTVGERWGNVFRQAEHANGRGYEAVWITEHHFSDYGYSPNPLMLLAKVADVAPDLRIGTAILVLPLWHPLRLAEDVATLDVLSNGRLDVGVGRGYIPYEFRAFGVDLVENRDMFSECLAIATKAWTQNNIEHDGRFWKIPPTTVFPKPVQRPHPPIWMAATTPPSIRAAVEKGYHMCTGTGGLAPELQMRNAYIDTILEEIGAPLDGVERSVNRFIFCSTNQSDLNEAIDQARLQVQISRALTKGDAPVDGINDPHSYESEPDRDAWQKRMILGDPDECIRRIQDLADAGLTYIFGLFEFGRLDHAKAFESLRLFTKEVVPALTEMSSSRTQGDDRAAITEAFLKSGNQYVGI